MELFKFTNGSGYKYYPSSVIIRYLNTVELGLWYTFTSLYGLAMLIDFGFQTIISRNVSYLWSGANSVKVKGLN